MPRKPSPGSGDVPGRDQQHALKKQAILRTAAEAFREAGYYNTSLDDIAGRLNVTKPTLYYYVRNKEDILLGCQQSGFEQIRAFLDEVERSGLDGREMLRRVMVSYGQWITSEFGVCVARLWKVRVSPQTRVRLDEARNAVQHAVRRIVERGVGDGSLRDCDVNATTSAMFGAFNWLAYWYEPKSGRSSPAEIGERFMHVFIDGLASGEPPAARHAKPERKGNARSN